MPASAAPPRRPAAVGGASGERERAAAARPAKGKGKAGEAESVKDRTKEKRKRDHSASFLGGRWKSDEEMRMRDFFDS